MDSPRPSFLRRWWFLLALLALGLVLAAGKLSVRSAATGEPVLPGVAGAPVLGPAPTTTPTPAAQRVGLRVRVTDAAGQPVSQAVVEVRDRFNSAVGVQETGLTGDAFISVPPSSGYIVTARKVGFAQGRVEGIDVGQGLFDVPGPQATAAPTVSGGLGSLRNPGQLVQVTLGPPEVAVTGSAVSRLYVGHTSPRVSVIDATSNLLLKHSDMLGQGRLTLMGLSRDGTKVYASWSGGTDVLVLNAADLTLERQIAVGAGGITSVAVHPQTGRLWVSTTSPDAPDTGALSEIDPGAPPDKQLLRRVPVGQAVFGLRFRPDGGVLYVPQRTGSQLSMFDPTAAVNAGTWRLSQWPTDFAFSPDGKSAYIVNLGSEKLLEIDTATGETRRAIDVGTGAVGVVAHPDGRRLLVSNQLFGYVQVVDLPSGRVDDLVPVGRSPQGLTLTPDANGLYVANSQSGSISLIDLAKRTVRETLSTGGSPYSLLLVRG